MLAPMRTGESVGVSMEIGFTPVQVGLIISIMTPVFTVYIINSMFTAICVAVKFIVKFIAIFKEVSCTSHGIVHCKMYVLISRLANITCCESCI